MTTLPCGCIRECDTQGHMLTKLCPIHLAEALKEGHTCPFCGSSLQRRDEHG
jgi:transcription initiation factor IIE alpha subunit